MPGVTVWAKRILALGVVLGALDVLTQAEADDCVLPPAARIFASASGQHGFRLTIDNSRRAAEGLLFTFDDTGEDKRIWRTRLVAVPARVLVADDGRTVVTIDQWCRTGYEHSLVVYGERGRVLADYRLEDLLARDEIRTRVKRSISSRWWAEGTRFSIEESARVMRVGLAWGREFSVNLDTGALLDKP